MGKFCKTPEASFIEISCDHKMQNIPEGSIAIYQIIGIAKGNKFVLYYIKTMIEEPLTGKIFYQLVCYKHINHSQK